MAKYNFPRAPKNLEKRFIQAYKEDLDKIGVTEEDILQKGVPDLDKVKPPKGDYWSAGYVNEVGESYLVEALREYYEKDSNNNISTEPEKKAPKQRGIFRVNLNKTAILSGDSEDDVSEEEIDQKIEDEVEEQLDEEVPEEVSNLIDEVLSDKPKPSQEKKVTKKTSRKKTEISKRHEEILGKILEDLIHIKHKLIQIKKAQEDKVAYEKRRDRLQAERLAFLERERQIEALPQSGLNETTTRSKKAQDDENTKTEKTWTERLGEKISNIFNVSLISGLGSMVFGGGGKTNAPAPPASQSNNFSISQLVKPTLRAMPFPGINMIPFAEGGTLTPLRSNTSGGTSIRPLEASTTANTGGTTFSRGFSMEDLKSPLADVMKLPLKVAGAALLSAISKLSSQFGVTDSKLQSDLSKMIGDVSKAFGLQKPTFVAPPPSGGNINISTTSGGNEQTVLANSLNEISTSLAPTGGTQAPSPSPQVAPPSTEQQNSSQETQSNNSSSQATQPTTSQNSSQETQSNNSGQTLVESARQAGTPGNSGTVEPKPYVGGSSNILKPQSANIAMNSSTTNIAQGGPTNYQTASDEKYSLKFNKKTESNYKISPSIQNSYETLNAFSSLEYSPLSKNITQTTLANSSVQEQNNILKYNPSQKLTPSSIAIAMGMTLPEDKSKLNSSGVNVISLPAINRTKPQPIPEPEVVTKISKPPSGFNGYNPYSLG